MVYKAAAYTVKISGDICGALVNITMKQQSSLYCSDVHYHFVVMFTSAPQISPLSFYCVVIGVNHEMLLHSISQFISSDNEQN